jgi:hypothetical protein
VVAAEDALEVLAVAAAQTAQRVRGSHDRYVFGEKLVVQTTKPDASANAPWTRTMVGPARQDGDELRTAERSIREHHLPAIREAA